MRARKPNANAAEGDITAFEVAEGTGRNLGVLLLARLVERFQLGL